VPLVLKSLNSLDGTVELTETSNPLAVATDNHSTKNQPDVIDPLSYRVPCPRTSGGIFSTSGYVACFGGSRLFLKSMQASECAEAALLRSMNRTIDGDPSSSAATATASSGHLEMKTQSADESNYLSQSSHLANRSTDMTEPSDQQFTSPHPPLPFSHSSPQRATTTATSSSSISPILYPKTYGDLLVYRRDVKLKNQVAAAAAAVAIQQNRTTNHAEDELFFDESDKMKGTTTTTPLLIKTTERYYPHFLMNGRRGEMRSVCTPPFHPHSLTYLRHS
jgi:hypothetical protein